MPLLGERGGGAAQQRSRWPRAPRFRGGGERSPGGAVAPSAGPCAQRMRVPSDRGNMRGCPEIVDPEVAARHATPRGVSAATSPSARPRHRAGDAAAIPSTGQSGSRLPSPRCQQRPPSSPCIRNTLHASSMATITWSVSASVTGRGSTILRPTGSVKPPVASSTRSRDDDWSVRIRDGSVAGSAAADRAVGGAASATTARATARSCGPRHRRPTRSARREIDVEVIRPQCLKFETLHADLVLSE